MAAWRPELAFLPAHHVSTEEVGNSCLGSALGHKDQTPSPVVVKNLVVRAAHAGGQEGMVLASSLLLSSSTPTSNLGVPLRDHERFVWSHPPSCGSRCPVMLTALTMLKKSWKKKGKISPPQKKTKTKRKMKDKYNWVKINSRLIEDYLFNGRLYELILS